MYVVVYITGPDEKILTQIAHRLVEEKLLACGNIFPRVTSVYAWKGKIQQDQEAVLIGKTLKSKFKKLSARVKDLHPYECPCVVSMSVNQGHAPYLKWIKDSLK